MFQSSSIVAHLLRGCFGFGLLGLSIYLFTQGILLTIVLGVISTIGGFFVLRGCPACWVIGLIFTISNSGKDCEMCIKKNK